MPVAQPTRTSRGASVLVGALVVDSVGNGLFLPLSLVYFVRLTPVPLAKNSPLRLWKIDYAINAPPQPSRPPAKP